MEHLFDHVETILSTLKQTTMKNISIKNKVIITVFVALATLTIVGKSGITNVFQSPEQAAAEASRKAQIAHEKARKVTCAYIGQLTAKCYEGNMDSCMRMKDKEDDFRANYEIAAYEEGGCVMFDNEIPLETEDTIAPAAHGVNDEINNGEQNPLFFGDEE